MSSQNGPGRHLLDEGSSTRNRKVVGSNPTSGSITAGHWIIAPLAHPPHFVTGVPPASRLGWARTLGGWNAVGNVGTRASWEVDRGRLPFPSRRSRTRLRDALPECDLSSVAEADQVCEGSAQGRLSLFGCSCCRVHLALVDDQCHEVLCDDDSVPAS